MGARVYAGHIKEIGWSRLDIRYANNNILSPLADTEVLHWHGDTFDLPENATLLASSKIYANQAFQIGQKILALQFHIEVAENSLEKWLIGHTCELRKANIHIPKLRENNGKYAQDLEEKAKIVFKTYLQSIQDI